MIDSFKGEYSFLSNFHPVQIDFGPITFPSVEHAYVAAKTTDPEIRKHIASIVSAGDVKRFGRRMAIRDGWDDLKLFYMTQFVDQKFDHPDLKEKLIRTHPHELIEGNWWGDVFWGVCNGVGENNLGKLLMQKRKKLFFEDIVSRTD